MKIFCESPKYIPFRAHPTDAGLDLRAVHPATLNPHGLECIHTGIHAEIPNGHFGLVALRSSLWTRRIIIPISIGIIDQYYRGEIMVPLFNTSEQTIYIHQGERLAQLLTIPCATPELEIVESLDELSSTPRGSGGFGSTGR